MATATFDVQAMARAADPPRRPPTWRVARQKGMPFRRAHELVGALVRDSVQRRVPLPELVAAHPSLGADAVAVGARGAVTRRTTPGGAGPPVTCSWSALPPRCVATPNGSACPRLDASGDRPGRRGPRPSGARSRPPPLAPSEVNAGAPGRRTSWAGA